MKTSKTKTKTKKPSKTASKARRSSEPSPLEALRPVVKSYAKSLMTRCLFNAMLTEAYALCQNGKCLWLTKTSKGWEVTDEVAAQDYFPQRKETLQ